jgi:two-component sensor histidine kinase
VALVLGNELELSSVATRRRVNALQEVEAQLMQKSRELTAIRRANEIVLDRSSWRVALAEFETILEELTGARKVTIEVELPGVAGSAADTASALEEQEGVTQVPLVSLGQHVGRVRLTHDRELGSFEVATSICQLVSRGLHQSFLERTIEEQAREIETIQNVAREILTASDYRAALVNISQEIGRHLGASDFCLWTGDEQKGLGLLAASEPAVADECSSLASEVVASRVITRTTMAEVEHWASPLILHDRVNGVLVLTFAAGRSAGPTKLTFLNYLSMPLAVMVEIYTRHRESNLAREIHHRVKNNLQIIASLLNLQLRRVEDPYAREPLENSIRRIMSIAVVHEALCEKDAGRVEAVGLIKNIAELVVESIGEPNQRLSVSVDGVSDLTLSSQQATNLAIVVNELLGNALKHGLVGEPEGNIQVSLEKLNGDLILSVVDDGRGLAPWFELGKNRGLGLQLIMNIARTEFSGSFSVEPRESRGVRARLVFPQQAIGVAMGRP